MDRIAMVSAAVSGVEGLIAGDDEIRRGGPSFTADTLSELATKYPNAELFTILGDDAASGLSTWSRIDEVIARSQLVVVDRPGSPVTPPTEFTWLRVESPRLEVSSTDLRARFSDGRPLDYLLTKPVLDEIYARSLYGATRIVRQ
jgi:nicotinate-nucleotide adenylyltransferase